MLAVLVTPQSAPIQPDLRLTTYSYSAGAASGIYDIARELGWRVERRIFLAGQRKITLLPNLMAEIAVFLVTANATATGDALHG